MPLLRCWELWRQRMAHVGSKDVFEQVDAGPYKLFVTVRPPNVIPGVAAIEVRARVGSGRSDCSDADADDWGGFEASAYVRMRWCGRRAILLSLRDRCG